MTPKQRRAQTIRLAKAAPEVRRRIIARMSWQDVLEFDVDYERWISDGQCEPSVDGWRTWLMMAGRGFGKTRAGAEWIHTLANARRGVRIALVGATIGDARSVMVEGVSGLIAVARRYNIRLQWEPSLGRLCWPNGSQATLFSGDNADGLRGPEHDFAWADEVAKWRDADDAWDNLQLGLRRGARPRVLATTTPRAIGLMKRILAQPRTVTTHGKTGDNLSLDEDFIEVMAATYGGSRVGRQEMDGELIEDVEGALWTRELLSEARVLPFLPGTRKGTSAAGGRGSDANVSSVGPLHPSVAPSGPPPRAGEELDRIVVAVDPPASIGSAADACGIVVAGARGDALFVLEDASVQGLRPEGWASRVAAAAARWGAGLVVAEANNGGAMVESVLKAADFELKVRLVHASRGKCARAEPVALRFERGKAFLAGDFPELEAELCGMIAGGGYEGPGRSPDRADAMVWALTALGETRSGVPRVARI